MFSWSIFSLLWHYDFFSLLCFYQSSARVSTPTPRGPPFFTQVGVTHRGSFVSACGGAGLGGCLFFAKTRHASDIYPISNTFRMCVSNTVSCGVCFRFVAHSPPTPTPSRRWSTLPAAPSWPPLALLGPSAETADSSSPLQEKHWHNKIENKVGNWSSKLKLEINEFKLKLDNVKRKQILDRNSIWVLVGMFIGFMSWVCFFPDNTGFCRKSTSQFEDKPRLGLDLLRSRNNTTPCPS